MGDLSLHDVRKVYGPLRAVYDVSLTIAGGEFFSVLGPSGCGKTTLLRLIAGFEHPTHGVILLDGQDITRLPPQARHIGMVFQNYALFPHMTVYENVAFGLQSRHTPKRDIRTLVEHAVETVGLNARLNSPIPVLSGGEQQRVALARAMVLEPKILLCDEPLSNLDLALRLQMREELKALQRRTHITTIYVTHDQSEAMSLSDRVAVMHDGTLEQVGTPEDIYGNPATPFVAQFLGSANMVEGERVEGGAVFQSGSMRLVIPTEFRQTASGPCMLAIKPESIRLTHTTSEKGSEGILASREYLGFVTAAVVTVGEARLRVTALSEAWTKTWKPGEKVGVELDWSGCKFFSRESP